MKKTIVTMLILLSFMFAVAQPAPELLYHKTQPNPAFISVSGLTMDFVDQQDYLFTYTDEMKCAGYYQFTGNPGFVLAMGKDQWDPGFDFREIINIGLYDTQTDTFFKLKGNATDWNNNPTDLIWMSLNLLRFEVTGLDGEIELQVDTELSETVLKIEGPDTWNLDTENESYIFNVKEKNMLSHILTASQSGEIKQVKRWFNDQWNNYQYTPASDNVKNVTFTAVGQSKWTGEIMQAQKLVQFLRLEDPEPPAGEVNLIADNEHFKITTEPFREFGTFTFIENKTGEKLGLTVTHERADGSKVNWSKGLKKGEKLRMLKSDDFKTVHVNWIKVAVSNYIRINKTYNLND
jgi:hypothetical protein